MKLLILALVVLVCGCQARVRVSANSDSQGETPHHVGYASGFLVEKVQDGDVTCYVTDKIGYTGGNISCVRAAP